MSLLGGSNLGSSRDHWLAAAWLGLPASKLVWHLIQCQQGNERKDGLASVSHYPQAV